MFHVKLIGSYVLLSEFQLLKLCWFFSKRLHDIFITIIRYIFSELFWIFHSSDANNLFDSGHVSAFGRIDSFECHKRQDKGQNGGTSQWWRRFDDIKCSFNSSSALKFCQKSPTEKWMNQTSKHSKFFVSK